MILNDFVDPNEAALAQVGGILGKLSGPSRMPTNLGSILGQAGAVGMATRQQVGMQNEQLAQTRMLREQQAGEIQERVRSRQEAMAERQKAEQSQVQFRSLLAESDDPSDPINVLGAGMRSGALNAQQYSTLLSNVQERQAARQQRMDELRLRLSAEERQAERDEQAKIRAEDLRRELQANQQVFQRDQQRLIASLRPAPAPEPLVPVVGPNGEPVYAPRSQAVGAKVPSSGVSQSAIESQVSQLSKRGDDLAPMYAGINEVNRLITPLIEAGDSIPGVGYGTNISGPFGVDISGAFIGEKGKNIRSAVKNVANKILKAESGAAVTLPEEVRQNLAMMATGAFSENDFVNAWPRIVGALQSNIDNIQAGYRPEAIELYRQRGGSLPFGQKIPIPKRKAKTPPLPDGFKPD